MSIVTNGILLAADINALKAEVKNEMLRRQYTGSVSAYGGTDYDYAVVPANGVAVLTEHYNKIQVPLAAVNSDAVPAAVDDNAPITYEGINALQAEVTLLKNRSQYAASLSATGCKASCTGLCYTSCSGTCSGGCWGCDGSCLTSCAISCGSGCGNNCTGCSGTCSSTCTGSCSGSCTATCANACKGVCGDNCKVGCFGTCTGGSGIAG